MSGRIEVQVSNGVGTLILDHTARRNALTVDMWQALPTAAERLAADDRVRVVVVRGAGEVAFASGADISEFEQTRSDAEKNRAYDQLVAAATGAIAAIDKPVIAAIHGFCMGGGLALALAADLRISADDGRFAIPAARLGVGYNAPGVATLMGLVGPSATKRILFTARALDAPTALRLGLVDEVVPKASLEAHVHELTEIISANAPLTLRAVKRAVAELSRPESQRDMAAVDEAIRVCFDSDDFAEGVRAFLDKRPPRFEGR